LLPLVIYLSTRLITFVMMVVASRAAGDVPRPRGDSTYFVTDAGTAPAGYLTTVTNWDGQWYWEIAAHGYPQTLPRDESGDVEKNPWAFFPLYPMIARAFMAVTHLGFPVVATTLSLVFGAAACLVLYRLVEPRSDRLGAILAVVGICAFICAPVFHMAYTDALALLLVVLTLLAVTRERYLVAGLCLLLLAFTRNVVAAFALFFLVVAVMRWRETRGDPAGRHRWVPLGALAGWSALLTLAWPTVAAVTTGEPFAYFTTQRAWVTGLDRLAVLRFVDLLSDAVGGWLVAGVIAAAWIALVLRLVTLGQRNRLLGAWAAAYAVYILVVADWNPTAVRYYLLALPVFWPMTNPSGSRRSRIRDGVLLAAVGLVMQWWWIRYAVTISPDRLLLP
jgi:hypothetical protein